MYFVRVLCLVVFFAISGCGGSGGAGRFAEATGRVSVSVSTGSGAVLAGATVRLGDRAAVSDAGGVCTFENVPVGQSPVLVTKAGFAPATSAVIVEKDKVVTGHASLIQGDGDAEYDVVVVGAGTGGVSAAIQASRQGVRVAMVEETDWIGGQMTAAAVTSLDEGFPRTRTGIYREYVERVEAYYRLRGKSTGTAYFDPTIVAFEPGVGQHILYQMLPTAATGQGGGIDLYLRSTVNAVMKSGNAVTGVVLDNGKAMKAKVVIDATECGDIIPLTGARYRSGNTTSDNLDLDACLNPITWTTVIRKHLDGIDPELVIASPPTGYNGIQSHFTASIRNDGNFMSKTPVNFFYHNAWRGMPDSLNSANYDASRGNEPKITKTGVNWFNDFPVTTRYLEDKAYRQQVNDEARLRTLQFLYYVQNDLGHTDWSVAPEEGFDSPYNRAKNATFPLELKPILNHFPLIPYVRESRRIIGTTTINASDIRRDGVRAYRNFPTSLAVGSYAIDLHGCSREIDLDCGDTAADISNDWVNNPPAPGLFQLPFETFIPESVDGFIAAEKNLSLSRLVQAASRLQPITMMTGQAAGVLAAVSVQQGRQPRNVHPLDVQWKLLEAGCQLSLHDLPDVPVSHPYWKHIQLALLYRIAGYPNTDFDVNGRMRIQDLVNLLHNAFAEFIPVSNPDEPATRGEFVVLLVKAMKLDGTPPPGGQAFPDVPKGNAAYQAVQILDTMGVFAGFDDGSKRFRPGAPITRGEISFLTVAAALKSGKSTMHDIALMVTDSKGPNGSVVVNSGAAVTASTNAILTLSATDETGIVQEMQVRKDGTDWFPWESYSPSRKVSLPEGDGIKTVYIRFRDAFGNTSAAYSDTIILDTMPPTGSVTIDANAGTTTSVNVTLTLFAADANAVNEFQISKDGSTWFPWEPFVSQRNITLVAGPGLNTVHVRFKDAAGNISAIYSDSIMFLQ